MIWASFISPITGGHVRVRYSSEQEAIRSLQYQGGQPDTHQLKIEPIEGKDNGHN